MIDMKTFQGMALSFPNTEQVPHFERIGFKITGRRMFATYLEKNNTAKLYGCIKNEYFIYIQYRLFRPSNTTILTVCCVLG